MAAWNNASGVVARRLQPNGTPVDAAPFLVMNPGFGPADIEALGGDFLVVGLRCGINCQYVFPIAARVRGLRRRRPGPVADPMGGTFCSSPRLAVLGGRWLLVWQANVTHDNSIAYTPGHVHRRGRRQGARFHDPRTVLHRRRQRDLQPSVWPRAAAWR